MRITPKSEQQLKEEEAERMKAFQCPDGTWDFEVIEATEGVSKSSGAEMITITMSVFAESDKPYMIKDYLLESVSHKVRHFFFSAGRGDLYDGGRFTADDCRGLCGKVIIKLGRASGNFAAKPEVKDYVVPVDGEPVAPRMRQAVVDTFGDENLEDMDLIPF
jgi:hypothetical protein